MTSELDGKVALVTGGGSGIGRSTSLLFAQRGAKVVFSDINESGGSECVAEIEGLGSEACFLRCDVSQESEVEKLIQGTVDRFGRLDAAFNNAGIAGDVVTRTADQSVENFDRTMAINLRGVWLCMKHEIRRFLAQGGEGSIVNTSSLAGLKGIPHGAAYVAAKHGVVGLTRTAALEYAADGIRVNAVCPGAIETPMLEEIAQGSEKAYARMRRMEPVGRLGTPKEIASAVVWLSSSEASFVTGLAMAVDGGAFAK